MTIVTKFLNWLKTPNLTVGPIIVTFNILKANRTLGGGWQAEFGLRVESR